VPEIDVVVCRHGELVQVCFARERAELGVAEGVEFSQRWLRGNPGSGQNEIRRWVREGRGAVDEAERGVVRDRMTGGQSEAGGVSDQAGYRCCREG
jgi:hypothetical protein